MTTQEGNDARERKPTAPAGGGIAKIILRWAARQFGGVTPDVLLAPEVMDVLTPHAKAAKRKAYFVLIPTLVAFGVVFCAAVILLASSLESSSVRPVLDQRTPFMWIGAIGATMSATLYLGTLLEGPLIRRRMNATPEEFVRYWATKEGWLPHRQKIFLALIAAPLLILFLFGAFCVGDVVDDRGITWNSTGIRRATNPYSTVRSITIYSALNAPVGLVQRPNLVVGFSAGDKWEFVPDNRDGAVVETVATFISDHSGIPVDSGTTRP